MRPVLAGRLLAALVLPVLAAPALRGQDRVAPRTPPVDETRPTAAKALPPRAVAVRPALRSATPALAGPALAARAGGLTTAAGSAAKLDPELRLFLGALDGAGAAGKTAAALAASPLAASVGPDGDVWVDVLAEVDGPTAALEALGAEVRTRVGRVAALRLPARAVGAVAARGEVRRIEAARKARPTMAASRAEIGADLVHAGQGLPRPFQGAGVVLGVLDSGFDVAHPDFMNEGGSRVRHLLEFLAPSGQREWSKAQIDTNPAGVTERDGSASGGHGTHVAGTAGGGGRANAAMRGIAPKADLVLVKGIRDADSNGGFSDADVLAGVDYIFDRADALGEPAVVNLSLGANGGPLDGSSLYERALSDLVRAGRLIVAANGNEGFDLIHAGATVPAGAQARSLLFPTQGAQALVDVWYGPGAVAEVGVAVFTVENGVLTPQANTGWVPVGSGRNFTALTAGATTFGQVAFDATTTADPGNGDGNALVAIRGAANADPSQYVWGVYTRGAGGRVDQWVTNGEFYGAGTGAADVAELPGNTDQTVGTPASAARVIAVGAYVTTNTWTDVDGNRREWLNPNPNRTGPSVAPVLGQGSYFSSRGPTRDGRMRPDVAAPGELVFSTRPQTLGPGYDRPMQLAGGLYQGLQGTSMASPHVAGVVALMLEANPTLDYPDAVEILRSTARRDAQTGPAAGNVWGAGRVDALAAVKEACRRNAACGSGGGAVRTATLARFDPAAAAQVYTVDRRFPLDSGFVAGTNRFGDRAKSTLFEMPEGAPGTLTGVTLHVGYRKAGTDAKTFAVEVYAGTAASGPTGAALYRQTVAYSAVAADADLNTPPVPTAIPFTAPVSVGSSFYVSLEFGAYTLADAGNLGLASTPFRGARVPHVWERWSDGTWHPLSDAWNFGGGTGTDGVDLYVQAAVEYQTATDAAPVEAPAAVALDVPTPNPVRSTATVGYAVERAGPVRLRLFDALGRTVATLADGVAAPGRHAALLDGRGLAAGVYFLRLDAGGRVQTRPVVVE